MKKWLAALALCGASACVEERQGDEEAAAASELEFQSCQVWERGVLVVSDGYWANAKTCCRRYVSSPNEQWCYICTDPRYLCSGFF
jgi:hypothetical protein